MQLAGALRFFQSLSPLGQAQMVGVLFVLVIAGLFFLLFGAAYFLCCRSWPCAGCQRVIDLNDNYLNYGLIFDCKECGQRNVIRLRARVAHWLILSAVAAFDFWAFFKLEQWRAVYKVRGVNWLLGEERLQAGDFSDAWLGSVTVALGLYMLYRVFIREKDPGEGKRLKL